MVVKNSNLKVKSRSPKLKIIKLAVHFGLITATLHFAFCTLNSSSALAATVSNDNFQLKIEQLDTPPEEERPTPTPLPEPERQETPGIAFIPSPFSFAISEPLIDFGVLSATNPVIRTTDLQVSSPGSGYQVFAYSNHVMRSTKSASIPDTTCDNGSCSEITPAVWENNLTYGFGFRCESSFKYLCPEGFEEENSFKQFSDREKHEAWQSIIRSDNRAQNHEASLTYRLNISGTQSKEAYASTVTFIAVPNF